ncbi:MULTISPECIES: VOC family protein [unclassified Streptomyces]|uniref:VOC family protein n=1 Tax=Streptomyces TaxID=1883 RepID=UPI0001C1A762|nr:MULTISPECIES: VOC family protein [unclassified Streptomyces]AEN08370.1 Glyoxalase/bleomycin resistance protein/dioxygenase [Streptomyces sp. SirexAA-E]MYR69983.1 VOC family protein [Streptomyces sp. SID4939]MYS02180.1 VOC family protein [Streptomyces sp. SID4940]MYT66486.1 VOC family protein [Streptomyces sp. SID8357]MYT83407.1 VOC family protein [Streptomyces sp. SID8360]
MPIATYSLVALDCPDPQALAGFYRSVLGGEVSNTSDRWYELRVPGGARIAFQEAPDHRPPAWPQGDHDSQQAHLDFDVTDIDRAQEEVLALGATPLDLDDRGGERGFRVYADPAGHPFCLCRQ